jgi:hypothetical protein
MKNPVLVTLEKIKKLEFMKYLEKIKKSSKNIDYLEEARKVGKPYIVYTEDVINREGIWQVRVPWDWRSQNRNAKIFTWLIKLAFKSLQTPKAPKKEESNEN